MNRLARLLGCTEGQAYTVVLGAALAALLLAGTVPAALRERPIANRRNDNGEIALDSSTAKVRPAPLTDAPAATGAAVVAPEVDDVTPPPGDIAAVPGRSSGAVPSSGRTPSTPTGGTASGSDPGPSSNDQSAADGGGPVPGTSSGGGSAGDGPGTRTPLRVLEGGWATTGSGTPAARAGVPADSLPVAASADGSTSRRSFVRLTGDATVLSLRLRTDAGANVNDANATLAACVITDPSWVPREAVGLDQAPPFDPKRCAKGARQSDGSWRFDLGAFPDRAGSAGFTLVPDPARTPSPFQIVFDPSPGAPS